MSTNTRKTANKKDSKQLSVTTRCVAIVFKKVDNSSEVDTHDVAFGEKLRVELHEEYREKRDPDKKAHGEADPDHFDAKSVLEEFKFRNKTCYWNPALVDSITSLEYVGFIEPLTILVKGDDIHLENIRTAWGRRVLKDPAYYKIERIGDVNGIEMQVVPQTQFIPLPEALCLVIMDLNNKQIVATLETVCEKLKTCYHGLHLPSNQLVYETLGTLIRERKVFHTGCGYFVVTPDTFRFHGDEMQSTLIAPWTHLHPMYIPAVFGQPFRQPTRSISCQVDADDNLIESCNKVESNVQNRIAKDGSLQRSQRSMSFSVRRSRDRTKKDEIGHDGSLKRSSSLKGRGDKENKPINDTNSEPVVKNEKLKKEKVSFFSKLFGRNKKKAEPEPKKPAVEYASFSAQFPPPEWTWYQQQLDKQVRTQTWVQQQIVKSGTWHHLNSLPTEFGPGSVNFGANSVPDRSSPLVKINENVDPNFDSNVNRRSHRKSHRNKARSPLVIVNSPSEGASPVDFGDYQTYRNSMGQQSIRLSSLPTRLSQGNDVIHSNYITHPRLSSTPRTVDVTENYKPVDTQQEWANKHGKSGERVKSHGAKKTHKSRKSKSHSNRHSSYHPSSRHISGMSGNPDSQFSPERDAADISMEYHGRMPEKFSSLGLSRSSGVNCIDLEKTEGHNKSHRSHRSRSYRQSFNEYDSRIRRDCDGAELLYQNASLDQTDSLAQCNRQNDGLNAHIYANVHVTNSDDFKPKLPERTRRKVSKDRLSDHHNMGGNMRATVQTRDKNRLDVLSHAKRTSLIDRYRSDMSYGNADETDHLQRYRLNANYADQDVSHPDCFDLVHSAPDQSSLDDAHGNQTGQSDQYRLDVSYADQDGHSEHSSEQGTVQSGSSHEQSSQDSMADGTDSLIDGTESSEHSLGTVIDTSGKKCSDNQMSQTSHGGEHSLGDSGFSSSHISERKSESNLRKEHQGFTCNDLKLEKNSVNNSQSKLDDFSDDSLGRIKSDVMYENVRQHQREVLNNMKYLHKEINVSSQNLNMPSVCQDANVVKGEYNPKQPVAKKFNFEGDFHVVGVV